MKKWISAVCILVVMLAATGCGESFKPTVSSLYIQKDGKITQAIVESFEKDYYSFSEFQSMTEKEISTYNSSMGEEQVSVNQLELEGDTAYLLLDYVNAEAYSRYSEEFCFVGTVEEALDEGLSFDMVFKDPEYEEYSAAEVTGQKSSHVAVLREEGVVQLETPVKYVSNNVDIISDRMLEVMAIEDEDEYAYIIY